eukprot:gene7529-10161_t
MPERRTAASATAASAGEQSPAGADPRRRVWRDASPGIRRWTSSPGCKSIPGQDRNLMAAAHRSIRTAVAAPGAAISSVTETLEAHLAQIEESHQRCAALGLSRIERPDYEPLMRSDLTVARERNLRLSTHAAPVMEMLFEQIVDSHSMIVLTDAQGTILHSVGDNDFLERADKIALAPGANWAEHSKGTNAIGTALSEEEALTVHGSQHYMNANKFLTCSASPIFDPYGQVIGALDVTGDHRSYHQHTLALVRMSAPMIENHMFADIFPKAIRIHFRTRSEFLGTLGKMSANM